MVYAIKSARLTGSQPQTETRDTNRVKLESSFFLFSPSFSEYLASRLSLFSVIQVIPTFQGMRRFKPVFGLPSCRLLCHTTLTSESAPSQSHALDIRTTSAVRPKLPTWRVGMSCQARRGQRVFPSPRSGPASGLVHARRVFERRTNSKIPIHQQSFFLSTCSPPQQMLTQIPSMLAAWLKVEGDQILRVCRERRHPATRHRSPFRQLHATLEEARHWRIGRWLSHD